MMAASPLPQALPRLTLKEKALWAWRSQRLFALVLVAVALILGAQLRFHDLARFDMSADEGLARPMSTYSYKTAFKTARAKAGVDYRLYDARHTFVTRLAENSRISEERSANSRGTSARGC